jgi:hypothetical protein
MGRIAKDWSQEKRKYIRLPSPVNIIFTTGLRGHAEEAVTKNISAEGLRFQISDNHLKDTNIDIILNIPGGLPISAKGRVAWSKRISLEDNAPFDTGVEFTEIEERMKNPFLKFLCDLIYSLPEES